MKRQRRQLKSTATYQPDGVHCCAKAKSTGKRCNQGVVPGRNVCRRHGGNGGRMPVHGRYSTALGGGRFAALYEQSLTDPALLNLEEPIALLDAHTKRLAERVQEGDTAEFRRRAKALWNDYTKAKAKDDPDGVAKALDDLGELLSSGADEDAAFAELTTAAERLAVRLEKAWGIRVQATQALNVRDLMTFLARVRDLAIRECGEELADRLFYSIEIEVLGRPDMPDALTSARVVEAKAVAKKGATAAAGRVGEVVQSMCRGAKARVPLGLRPQVGRG